MTAATEPPELDEEELTEILAGDEPNWSSEPAPPLDATHATAYLYQLDVLKRHRTELMEATNEWIRRVKDRVGAQVAGYDARVAWLETALRGYHQAVLSIEPDRLTIPLPSGRLESKMGQPEWQVTNEDELGAWLWEHYPECIGFPEAPAPRIDRNAMKSVLTKSTGKGKSKKITYGVDPETGERPPGLVVEDPERGFTPKPS